MKLSGQRVLLVEDEPIIGFAPEDMIIAEGAKTHFASSLDDALELARSQVFDAALVDINLHGRESYPLARELLKRNVAVVFATGYGVEPLTGDLADVPAIAKPYDMPTIRAAFAGLAERAN